EPSRVTPLRFDSLWLGQHSQRGSRESASIAVVSAVAGRCARTRRRFAILVPPAVISALRATIRANDYSYCHPERSEGPAVDFPRRTFFMKRFTSLLAAVCMTL